MLFNSLSFLIFFPVVTLAYLVLPARLRVGWLLVASYYFYMSWNASYALLIGVSTLATYASGRLLEAAGSNVRRKKAVVAVCFAVNLGILFFFKYFDFTLENLNFVLAHLHLSTLASPFSLVLPVGISFYTFQALSYTVDVYRGEVKAEKSILDYALFVSFFPQLVAGPIERSGNLVAQIHEVPKRRDLWDYRRITNGLTVMLWGLFLKMVVADRIALLVDGVFDNYHQYGTFELILGAVAFAIQIYCDFGGYSTVAIGAAQVMGFTLMENFDTPYFSRTIQEFWRRWHISLSSWFRDYLYIPLGGSRCGKVRRYCNIMITFLASGLWHGANWTYVIWGGLHGVYQIVGAETRGAREGFYKKIKAKTDCASFQLGRVLTTFVLADLAWIFFRADSVRQAVGYILRMATKWDPWVLFDGRLYQLGLDRFEMNVLLAALLALLLVDLLKYCKRERLDAFLEGQCLPFRWLVLLGLVFAVLVYGQFGPGFDSQQFIYFQF